MGVVKKMPGDRALVRFFDENFDCSFHVHNHTAFRREIKELLQNPQSKVGDVIARHHRTIVFHRGGIISASFDLEYCRIVFSQLSA